MIKNGTMAPASHSAIRSFCHVLWDPAIVVVKMGIGLPFICVSKVIVFIVAEIIPFHNITSVSSEKGVLYPLVESVF